MSSYKNFETDKMKNKDSANLFKKGMDSSGGRKATTSKEGMEDRIVDWTTYYRKNMHRFVQHYLGLELFFFQSIILYLMNTFTTICIVAVRGIGKSYIIAIFACAKCILYPMSSVVIASATKKQAGLIVSEKIKKQLMPASANLRREIKEIKTSSETTEVIFHNGSSIIVVPATDNARGYRATCIIYEEFRMIKKEIIDSVLSPFLFVRPAPFLKKSEYRHLAEEPMEIYISSAWYKQHWMWDTMKIFIESMYKTKDTYLLGFDLALSLREGLKTKKGLIKDKKKADPITFSMEYENIMQGASANAYFTYDMLNKNQGLKKAFYPRQHLDVVEGKKNPYKIKKQKGEIRIVTADISMVAGNENDNTVLGCVRALPSKAGYNREIPYMEHRNGGHTKGQALRIKQLFYDFDADYLVLDLRNSGISIFDELSLITTDDERSCEYEAWTCMNDEKTKNRITIEGARECVFVISATAQLNDSIAKSFRNVLKEEKINLLINSTECKDYLEKFNKTYSKTSDIDVKVLLEQPYLETEFLINETVGLQSEINSETGLVKLKENRNARKDRYSSISYGSYFIGLLEKELLESMYHIDDDDDDLVYY